MTPPPVDWPGFETVTSPANPAVKRVVQLRKARNRKREHAFVAEGWREVERAFAAGLHAELLVVCPDLIDDPPRLRAFAEGGNATPPGPRRLAVPAALFAKATYHREPEGVLAVFREPIRALPSLAPPTDEPALVLIAVGAEKPGNLGAMVRTAEAAGAFAVIAADTTVDPYNPNAIRNSTGAVFSTPTVAADRDAAVAWARRHGLCLVAAVADDPSTAPGPDRNAPAAPAMPVTPYTDADLAGPLALVTGPEADGLDEGWIAQADLRVTIPTRGRAVDSLNVSVAAGVLLFEARRQRDRRALAGRPG